IIDTSKSSLLLGAGPTAVFALTDAVFGPLAARQVVQAREAGWQTATNDSLLAVAGADFTVQEARGSWAGALEAAHRRGALGRRVNGLGPELVPLVEASRARTEAARRRQAVFTARERWHTASADLVRILRVDPRFWSNRWSRPTCK